MPVDTAHTWVFTIGGTARVPESATMTDNEGGEIDTLTLVIDDEAKAITITPWMEVTWTYDGGTNLFGGYVASVSYEPKALGRTLTVNCEGYITRCHKVDLIRKTYVNTTPGDIVADLFTTAGLSDFDAATHVTAGSALDAFTVDNESLADVLDRLSEILGWVWRVDGEKAVWFGAVSSDAAAFAVSDFANANLSTVFPVESFSYEVNADEPINKVTVHAGFQTSAVITDTFSGDGTTTTFNLTYQPISRIDWIGVGGTAQRHGTLGWHANPPSWPDPSYLAVVNYRAGYVVFQTPPPAGVDNITVKYQYQKPLSWTKTDAASVTAWGLTFWHHVYDSSIASKVEADAIIDAILADHAYAAGGGSFSVGRLGLRAGQQIAIEYAPFGIDTTYTIRSVQTEIRGRGFVRCSVSFGGRQRRLSEILAAGANQPAYDLPTTPEYVGGIQQMQVNNVFGAIKPSTTFTPP